MSRTIGRGLLLLGLLIPLVPLVVGAAAATWRYPALVPTDWSLRGLRTVASPASDIPVGLLSSTTIAVSVALIASAIGLCAGRALGLYTFRGKRVVQFLLLAPVIVPGLAVVLGIQIVFIRYGLADRVVGVIVAHLIPTTPYVTLVMASVYANYDVSYEDQARVLGATPVQVLRSVTLPTVLPGLAVAALFAFLISWSEYVLALLVGGGSVRTLPLLLFAYLAGNDTNVAAALSLVIIFPPLVLVAAASRFLSGEQGALVGFSRL
ncbi:MAG TPA: ABC transporter permease subunit [Acidimicrobiales bacterium]|nr:ABC transporter permease subunit [Acidimicrobiales bacterium]